VEKREQPKHWDSVKDLFGAALEVEREQRSAFLREACGSNESLRAEIESLLSAYDDSSELSQSPWPAAAVEATAPQFIGPYHLLEKLGEGGMGQVWLAEQSAPVHRRVALKLIRTGIYDSGLLQRFQAERQSLAIMDHPAIAKVFDAGTTEAGQPYFVMEYVPGLPITEYCDQKKLSIRERIEPFIQVCEGVQHAHQKAIIHRDIKPANILVVEVDGKPRARIIDFGLAKAMTPQICGETLFTQAGAFLGTPGYMSPEQADPGVQDIDTRTDVYSLGVVLYVLLTGCDPFDTNAWKKLPLHEVLRRLREEDAPAPSTRLSSAHDASAPAATARGTEPRQLANQLRGDLDWITMKAVEKDRNRRYGTPFELAADLRRYLGNEPVSARPAGTGYRLRKYVQRHRIGVVAAIVIGVLLASFGGVQALQLRRITRERDRANRIATFMTDMFKLSDPTEVHANNVSTRDVLDKASKDIERSLASDPEMQGQLMRVMGNAYKNLGVNDQAESLLEQAVQLDRRSFGPSSPETLAAMTDLAWTLSQEGRIPEAEKLQRETVQIEEKNLGAENPTTLGTKMGLAVTLDEEGRHEEAEKLARETLDIQRRVLRPEDTGTLANMGNLSAMLGNEGKYAEAEQLQRETLEMERRILGADNLKTLSVEDNLADTLIYEKKDAEAEEILLRNFANVARLYGADHPELALINYGLGCIALHRGQRGEAISRIRTAVEHGFTPQQALLLESDSEMKPIQDDPRFVQIMAIAHQQANAGRNGKSTP
jgi:non-specific serine/threonine protein kinase/serine/threonine-protein kinase